ncbi:DUF3574 domain-containing protein [Novosphingobium meiothermophilum]|uniref:DUF3574 domain-containing protein n=1 Tax=Novosphingobium meiothermophilum TaxID=2202251 RepID=UPI001374B860|nr:DUF3574 domain-containing protein [Novosphingobium meiothermophilum]
MALTHLTRIAFGMARPDGGSVTPADWSAFEADTVAATFPDGFTVLPCSGGWRDAATGMTIREPSMVVEVAHDASPETLSAIRTVAGVYKALFQQDAVMVTTVAAQVEFL